MSMDKNWARVRSGLLAGLAAGKELASEAGRQARTLEEDIKARREIDVAGMVAGLRARLTEQLVLESLPIDSDLGERRLPVGLGRIRTEAWRSEKLRKVVLSHIYVPGVIEGLALTALPVFELDSPCFAADLMALPWRFSVNVDAYGRDWQTKDSLRSLQTTFMRLGGDNSGPLWAAKLGSGHGLHAKLRPRQIEEGFAALSQGLYTYLGELADAPPGRSNEAQEQFFYTFHQNGPKKGMLRRLFGDEWAERYSRLVFE
jgi:hypothetical protein